MNIYIIYFVIQFHHHLIILGVFHSIIYINQELIIHYLIVMNFVRDSLSLVTKIMHQYHHFMFAYH